MKVATGPEEMTVAETDGLPYLPRHPRNQLERALRIPALSPGWQGSFRALLESAIDGQSSGNPALSPAAGPPPAWSGFRTLRIAKADRESSTVISLTLEPTDTVPLPPFLPGQFVVLRLEPAPGAPPILRSYSLSGASYAGRYRVSVKLEPGGAAGAYLHFKAPPGDLLDVSAPGGTFTLGSGDGPVVLISAGVGATPVLAMLHALAAEGSKRETWWLHGARNGSEQSFAGEVRMLLGRLPAGRGNVRYSSPAPRDRRGLEFDAPGRLTPRVLDELGVPDNADFNICGPASFMEEMSAGLAARGVAAQRIRTMRSEHSRCDSNRLTPSSSTCRARRQRALGLLRSERPHGAVGRRVRQPARPRRGL